MPSTRTVVATTLAGAALLAGPVAANAVVSTIAAGALQAFDAVARCLSNQAAGLPCLNSDGANIRSVHTAVTTLARTVDENQRAVMGRFDQVENLLNQQNLRGYADALRTLDVNGTNALRAWDAILACMTASTSGRTSCQGFAGGRGLEPAGPIATSIADTRAYMLRQIAFMPTNIDVTASLYTGTPNVSGTNGAAYWSWWSNLRMQDQAVGAAQRRQDNARVQVIAPTLSRMTRQDTQYYANLFQNYGYLMVLGAALSGDPGLARERQRTVDRVINGTDRFEVTGTVNHYMLPALKDRTMIVLVNGRAVKVAAGSRLGAAMRPGTVHDIARVVNSYGSAEAFARGLPDAMPDDRWYVVKQNITRMQRNIRTCPFETGCVNVSRVDVNELASSGAACRVQMRPMNSRPAWPAGQEYWMYSYPAMGRNFFWNSYNRYVDGPWDYRWSRRQITTARTTWDFGFGSWVKCVNDPVSSQRVMPQRPAVLG